MFKILLHFQETQNEGSEFVKSILAAQGGIDVKRDKSEMRFFSNSKPIVSSEFQDNAKLINVATLEESAEDGSKKEEEEEKAEEEEDDSDDEEESKGKSDSNQGMVEEAVHDNGRVRRKVVFSNDLEMLSDNESESSDEETDDQVQFRGLSRDADIKSKITDVLSKFERKVPKTDSDPSSDESGIEIEGLEGGEKRKHSNSESKDEQINIKRPKTDNYEDSAVRWKDNLAQKASDAFIERQNNTRNLFKLVYGKF